MSRKHELDEFIEGELDLYGEEEESIPLIPFEKLETFTPEQI